MIIHRLLVEAVAARAMVRMRRLVGDQHALADVGDDKREFLDWLHSEYRWVCPKGCNHPLKAVP